MAFANPAIDPPRLGSPTKRYLYIRSPSRSPVRGVRDLDPLLRDLSPTTTLRAFSTDPNEARSDKLFRLTETSSHSERALGVKAAQACLDLRSWSRELESWEWPGTFDVPEPARKKMRMSTMSGESMLSCETAAMKDEDSEYWGSLPAHTVQAHDQRTEEIGQQLDDIDVEELKDFVLSAHNTASSRPASINGSINSIGAATDLRRLDDFTALITATILQALPWLSRLGRLLDVWTMRISVLKAAPSYLADLRQAKTDLDHGWAAIAISPTSASGSDHASFSSATMTDMKKMISSQVDSLGRRLDRFLDDLEGREDTVPDAWIEDFETLEQAYGDWVVDAERKVHENEWRLAREEESKKHDSAQEPDPSIDIEPAVAVERDDSVGPSERSGKVSPPTDAASSRDLSNERSISPMVSLAEEQHNNDLTPKPAQGEWPMPIEMPREDSQTLPEEEAKRVSGSDQYLATLTTGMKENQSPTKPRHVPIVLDYIGDGQEYPAGGLESSSRDISPMPESYDSETLKDSETPPMQSIAHKRAMFSKAEIEKSDKLQRASKTPVRPFEHASNAFTRLFRKEHSPEQSRTSALRGRTSSHSSLGSKRDSGSRPAAEGDAIVWGGRKPLSPVSNGNRKANLNGARNRSSSSLAKDEAAAMQKAERLHADVVRGDDPKLPPMPEEMLEDARRSRTLSPIKQKPETYQPKRLSSPFHSPAAEEHFADNWPLSPPSATPEETVSPVKNDDFEGFDFSLGPLPDTPGHNDSALRGLEGEADASDSSPEIHSPRVVLESEAFHSMFVDSFPNTPDERPKTASPHKSIQDPISREGSRQRLRPRLPSQRNSEPTLDSSMLGDDGDEQVRLGSGNILTAAGLPSREDMTPGSVNSDMSSPEIKDASSIGYFHVSPGHSRQSSSATAKNTSRSPLSPVLLKLKIPDEPRKDSAADGENEEPILPGLYKRASIASIESHPRSDLRAIDVQRRDSGSSNVPQTPTDTQQHATNGRKTPTSPLGYNEPTTFPSPPSRRSFDATPGSPVSPVTASEAGGTQSPSMNRIRREEAPSPIQHYSPKTKGAPLNFAMGKRRGQLANGRHNSTASPAGSPAKSPKTPLKPGEDNFDRHVSEVLERIPSDIRFRSRPGADTPTTRTAEPRNYAGPRPKAPRVFSGKSQSGPGMTIAPADPSPKKYAGESEVKLYHLTQAGREEPIKLFVRLVGEGERVMVRVGGGWADLADYLRQYAEHHGSRTVSGSALEVQTASNESNRRISGLAEPKSRVSVTPAASTPRPGSNDENLPLPADATQDVDGLAPSNIGQTPTNAVATQSSTPKTVSTKSSSRPSTAGDNSPRPQSRQTWNELGSAGPSSAKRADLPEQKARWVEGMIEKAKASAEKSKDNFGQIGKVGATRRMIFRQSSGAGVKDEAKEK